MNALQPPRRGADILAVAFGTTVVMWSLLYVAALAMWIAVAIGLAASMMAAGYAAGRYAGRGPAGGAGQGLVLAGVTLLILLGLVGRESPGQAVWWVVGFELLCTKLAQLWTSLRTLGSTWSARPPAT